MIISFCSTAGACHECLYDCFHYLIQLCCLLLLLLGNEQETAPTCLFLQAATTVSLLSYQLVAVAHHPFLRSKKWQELLIVAKQT